ncbi:unnamed protein product [Cyprideis torosa]|uniref:Cytosol aminopeptidase n=1 Tax=Cyprideis torosa TaxID=163714 RepID=A0A7R8W080_9CRUS|nr:unnamed protein product [Cyprideis torosa]CAG0879455.1 unnamed protein product [Cyprideis torosa]
MLSGRQGPGSLAGIRDDDLCCPICLELMNSPVTTRCGHSFCQECIVQAFRSEVKRCPKCSFDLNALDPLSSTMELTSVAAASSSSTTSSSVTVTAMSSSSGLPSQLIPNFVLNDLVTKRRRELALCPSSSFISRDTRVDELKRLLHRDSIAFGISDIDWINALLQKRREELETKTKLAQLECYEEFLSTLHTQKQVQLSQLQREVSVIEEDLQRTKEEIREAKKSHGAEEHPEAENSSGAAPLVPSKGQLMESFSCVETEVKGGTDTQLRRKRLHMHLDDLTDVYLSKRTKTEPSLLFDFSRSAASSSSGNEAFEEISASLVPLTRYTHLVPLATLNYTTDFGSSANIVSSIEFDKDSEFFAIAGVTKRIKVFDFASVVQDPVDVHYPAHDITCYAKISCATWNAFHKGILACSDYEGGISVHDVPALRVTALLQEHEKRCWSVDFSPTDPKLLASGSDDSKVKIWSLERPSSSMISIVTEANVCSVKFNPKRSYMLALGSADHHVHYYDIRKPRQPLRTFKGHKKAVSYVRFLDDNTLISASTDSCLKIWSEFQSFPVRTLQGHTNEKNFVGLTSNGGNLIACGSENNSLYVYTKGLSNHLLTYQFETVKSILERDKKDDDASDFVSAVCWKKDSNVVLGANSQGMVKILDVKDKLKKGKTRILYGVHETYPVIAIAGLGPEDLGYNEQEERDDKREAIRNAVAAGCGSLRDVGCTEITVDPCGDAEAAAEGAYLSTFVFDPHKTSDKKAPVSIEVLGSDPETAALWKQGSLKAQGQNLARYLTEMPANHMTPTIFAQASPSTTRDYVVEFVLRSHDDKCCIGAEVTPGWVLVLDEADKHLSPLGVKVEAHDRAWAEKMKMGSFLSVAKGSDEPCVFLEMTYEGGKPGDAPIALVGKGITFDSGGISLKVPSSLMNDMRADMGGGAVVVGTIFTLASLKAPINIKGLVPLAENMPNGRANKVGDVVYAMNGKSIQIMNTDAEGRLILADALCYADTFKPTFVLDIATLTGAMLIALGSGACGVFTNSSNDWKSLRRSGERTGDRVWRMPLWDHYISSVKPSASADLCNISSHGRDGGSCTAAAFLSNFTKCERWMHLDMAGVMAHVSHDKLPYLKKGMTGRPTRTLACFIQDMATASGN